MKDYKQLVAQMRSEAKTFTHSSFAERMLTDAANAIEELQAELDAAKADIAQILSMTGLSNYEVCAYCGMNDDGDCVQNTPVRRCNGVWRGKEKQNG